MAHNQRFNPDAFYKNGTVLPASYAQQLDTAQFKAINADAGGTWSPTSPVYLGGAGLAIAGPSSLAGGASIQTLAGSGDRIVCGANDTPLGVPGHVLGSRSITTSINACARTMGVTRGFGSFGRVNVGNQNRPQLSASQTGKRILCPLRVHHGAMLTSVFLNVTITPHTQIPASLPQWRVYTMDTSGNIAPLNTNPALVRAGGWLSFSPAPATAATYSGPFTLAYSIGCGSIAAA
jgi:hypothetical protein